MRATLSKTKFKDAPIVPVAAKPANLADETLNQPIGNFYYDWPTNPTDEIINQSFVNEVCKS